MVLKNSFGLSRTIDSKTKRQIRKECGFGCIVCGNSIYQYEHILPEFHDAKKHEVDKIGLLCASCHDKVTRGIWPKDFIQEKRQHPFCLNEFSSKYKYYIYSQSDITIELGKIKFINVNNVIDIDGTQILAIYPPEEKDSPPRINAQFFDRKGNKIASINHNEWNGNPRSFDIEAIGSKIKIRSELYKIDLEINLVHPNIFQINKLHLNFNNKTIKGNKQNGYKIETNNSSILIGLKEIIYKNKPFGISIQGDKIFLGSPKIINYTNLKGEEFQLDGHYEISGADVKIDYDDSMSPKLHIKTKEKGGEIKIKFELPEKEQPKIHLNFIKQGRNDNCNCGSGLKYKRCCLKNEQILDTLVNDPVYLKILKDISAAHKIKNISYRFKYSTKIHSTWLQWSENFPFIVINSAISFNINNISYSLLLWKLKKEGYNYYFGIYKDFRESIIQAFQDLLFSIPIIESLKIEGLQVERYFINEVKFIKTTMENKKPEAKDSIISGISIYESIKILRLKYNTEYLKAEEKKSIMQLFKKKSPVAYELSSKLDTIIKSSNIFDKKGFNECINRVFLFFNDISKGAFNEICK